MSKLGSLLDRLFPVLIRGLVNAKTLAMSQGQARSIAVQKPVDSNGNPIPWYTYPAIEYLQQFDFRKAKVFEFGAGNSSLFWAKRASYVVAVESDSKWHMSLVSSAPPNLNIYLRPEKPAYLACLLEREEKFDIVAIDGRWRHSCAQIAPKFLEVGGLILLDNSDWHSKAADELRNAGFFQIDFNGFGPINAYTWTTSLFLRADVRLQTVFAKPKPTGGLSSDNLNDD